MSQWEKLINRIFELANDLRFEELRKVLESYGYEMLTPKGGSSHASFRKPGKARLTIPRHDPIKQIYVRMVREAIEEEIENGKKC